MNKYDKMLELNKRKSEEKVERATLAIRTMVLEKEKVSVPALMQKTGLSRGFFYKNPIVRSEIDAAMEQQAGIPTNFSCNHSIILRPRHHLYLYL